MPSNEEPMHIRAQRIDTIEVPVEGVSPLIVSRFDEKAKEMMLAAQQSKTRKAKEPKDPDHEFERRRYRLNDGRDGFPAVGFKAAIVGGARLFEGVTMTALKTQLYVHGEPAGMDMLVPIEGPCTMREDTVRVGNGVADLRYRPMYWPWSGLIRKFKVVRNVGGRTIKVDAFVKVPDSTDGYVPVHEAMTMDWVVQQRRIRMIAQMERLAQELRHWDEFAAVADAIVDALATN
jgi:ABC-type transporter lipoprotein component MlaA